MKLCAKKERQQFFYKGIKKKQASAHASRRTLLKNSRTPERETRRHLTDCNEARPVEFCELVWLHFILFSSLRIIYERRVGLAANVLVWVCVVELSVVFSRRSFRNRYVWACVCWIGRRKTEIEAMLILLVAIQSE